MEETQLIIVCTGKYFLNMYMYNELTFLYRYYSNERDIKFKVYIKYIPCIIIPFFLKILLN